VIDEEDDWEEMAQLEGLGQGGRCYICVVWLMFVAVAAALEKGVGLAVSGMDSRDGLGQGV
jgi:hypothetical protein